MRTLPILAFGLLPIASCSLQGQATELRTTAADRTALSITIYQNDLAAVRDSRRVILPIGITRLAFADLAGTIRPKSAYLLGAGLGLKVLERNFEFNLLNPISLMEAGLGGPVAKLDPNSGVARWGTQVSLPYPRGLMNPHASALAKMARFRSAWLVQPTEALLVHSPGGFEGSGSGVLAYKRIPPVLRASPTLLQTLDVGQAGPYDLHLFYTATSLSWKANYIAILTPDSRHMDLQAFATVTNQSGENFPNATFQLVAGEPNIVIGPPESRNPFDPPALDATQTMVVVAASLAGPPIFREEKVSEFPLFTLDRPTSLDNGQVKQLALFHADKIPVAIHALVQPPNSAFEYDVGYLDACYTPAKPQFSTYSPLPISLDMGGDPVSNSYIDAWLRHLDWTDLYQPPVQLEALVQNTKANGLGRALPSGSMDIRYRDPGGVTLPLQQVYIPGTPTNESIEFPLSNARNMTAERRVISMTRIVKGKQIAWELEIVAILANHSGLKLPAIFREPVYSGWTLLQSNIHGHRSGENAWDFDFTLKPHTTVKLHYRVRTNPQPMKEE